MAGGDPVSDPLALSLGLELFENPQPVLDDRDEQSSDDRPGRRS